MQDAAPGTWRELLRASWEGAARRASKMATLTPASYAGMLLEMAGGSVATAQRHIPKALDARFAGEVYARLANVADEDDRAGR